MSGRSWGCAGLVGAALAAAAAAEEPFAIQAFALGGRVVAAELVDLDGDARADLLCATVDGMPPDERRTLYVFYQKADRTFPGTPDWSAPLPDGAAAFDLAELDARPGAELILLRRDRLTLLSFAGREVSLRDLPVGSDPTIAVTG